MRRRSSGGAGLVSGLKGDCAAGTKKMRSSESSSIAASATSRWPLWTGSNDPPKSAMRFMSAAAVDARVAVLKVFKVRVGSLRDGQVDTVFCVVGADAGRTYFARAFHRRLAREFSQQSDHPRGARADTQRLALGDGVIGEPNGW